MIRFCDKTVYNVMKQDISKISLLSFFLEEDGKRMKDVIAVYDNNEQLCGTITYNNLLVATKVEDCINRGKIVVGDNFWQEAKKYFETYPKMLLTILDSNGQIIGFAYDDNQEGFREIDMALTGMEKCGVPALQNKKYQYIKMLVIINFNEFAWRCCKLFEKLGYQVCVFGEEWEWFGYESGTGNLDYADFEKMYLYAEGRPGFSLLRDAFHGILTLADESIKEIYKTEIQKLVKLDSVVYEFILPEVEELDYQTPIENSSFGLHADIGLYLTNGEQYSLDRKECLEQIYGAENVAWLREHNIACSVVVWEGGGKSLFRKNYGG